MGGICVCSTNPSAKCMAPRKRAPQNGASLRITFFRVMGSKRLALLPNIPTFSELGIQGFENNPFYGVFAPQRIPLGVCDRLSLAIKDVLSQSKFTQAFNSSGIDIKWSSAKQFSNEVSRYSQDWQKIFQESQAENLHQK